MRHFRYEATNLEGDISRGKILAEDSKDVQRRLKNQNLTPLLIQEINKANNALFFKKKVKKTDYIFVLDQLHVLLKAGVPLVEAVESVAQSGAHPMIAEAFMNIGKALKRGEKFSSALKKFLSSFPDYVFQLVLAGEFTGDIAGALEDSAKQMTYEYQLAQDIKSALTYPVILIIVGVGAILFIFTFVVPKFESLFMDNADKLPGLANFVMNVGISIRNNLNFIFIFLGIIIAALITISQKKEMQIALREMGQKIPLFGIWMRESETGKWATMMAILLKNKIPLMKALELSRTTLKIDSMKTQMNDVSKAVRGGTSLAQSLTDNTFFSNTSIHLIRVGERAGNLAEMLSSLSTLYAREGKERMKKFMALIQPLSIVIVGGLIGIIVGGIIQGISSLTDIVA